MEWAQCHLVAAPEEARAPPTSEGPALSPPAGISLLQGWLVTSFPSSWIAPTHFSTSGESGRFPCLPPRSRASPFSGLTVDTPLPPRVHSPSSWLSHCRPPCLLNQEVLLFALAGSQHSGPEMPSALPPTTWKQPGPQEAWSWGTFHRTPPATVPHLAPGCVRVLFEETEAQR